LNPQGGPPRPRLIYAGTPEFAVPALAALVEDGWPVLGVWTQPDRPAGRGRSLAASPVKQWALAHGLTVYQPAQLRGAAAAPDREAMRALRPDVLVVVAYGLLLPQSVLDIPLHGCLNLHASLLPRWRGAAPIQRAIEAGDAETGITLMQMTRGLDQGPMLAKAPMPITPEDTAATLHDRLAAAAAMLLRQRLADYLAGALVAEPQEDAQATYAPKLDKAEADLDFRLPAEVLARKIRAFDPFPVARALWQPAQGPAESLRLWAATVLPDLAMPGPGAPGVVMGVEGGGLDVVCGRGVLRLTHVQRPGGKVLAVPAWLAGLGGREAVRGGRFVLPVERDQTSPGGGE